MWQKREGWADGTEERHILPPTTTIEHKVTYRYGKTVVEVFPMMPAHTYGDLVVYLPQHKILFVGDIGFFYVAPFCQNAHPSNWINVVDQTRQDGRRRDRARSRSDRQANSTWPRWATTFACSGRRRESDTTPR